jgi:hypothetical protein
VRPHPAAKGPCSKSFGSNFTTVPYVKAGKHTAPPTTPEPRAPIMAPRESSPALSENEFDIFDALAGGEDSAQEMKLGADLGVDLGFGSDDGSGDEAFIAAKQAAANRKTTNAQGKSVKKGGGFQAMGLNAMLLKAIQQKVKTNGRQAFTTIAYKV